MPRRARWVSTMRSRSVLYSAMGAFRLDRPGWLRRVGAAHGNAQLGELYDRVLRIHVVDENAARILPEMGVLELVIDENVTLPRVIAFVDGHHREDSRRSEEHTSELQSLMRISYAVFFLKKKTSKNTT